MKRRQFLGIACASTAFASACKKDEPTPATIVKGYITDSQGKPLEGLEVEYTGNGGGGNPSQIGGFGSPSPYVTFSEKSWTNDKGFFQIFKVIPGGVDADNTAIYLSATVFQKYNTIEATKNGVKVGGIYGLIDQGFNIKPGTVNEYLITLK